MRSPGAGLGADRRAGGTGAGGGGGTGGGGETTSKAVDGQGRPLDDWTVRKH